MMDCADVKGELEPSPDAARGPYGSFSEVPLELAVRHYARCVAARRPLSAAPERRVDGSSSFAYGALCLLLHGRATLMVLGSLTASGGLGRLTIVLLDLGLGEHVLQQGHFRENRASQSRREGQIDVDKFCSPDPPSSLHTLPSYSLHPALSKT